MCLLFPIGKRGRKRCGGYGFGGCGGCGGLGGYGGYGGFGGCGGYGFGLGGLCDWCADGTMCANCKGGFGPPIGCGGCNCGCSPSLTFPCVFGASVNNPGCECCKKKPPKGKCIWPCMWPCCCECDPPKFKFKPLEPKPVCHCPHKRYYRLHQSQTSMPHFFLLFTTHVSITSKNYLLFNFDKKHHRLTETNLFSIKFHPEARRGGLLVRTLNSVIMDPGSSNGTCFLITGPVKLFFCCCWFFFQCLDITARN